MRQTASMLKKLSVRKKLAITSYQSEKKRYRMPN